MHCLIRYQSYPEVFKPLFFSKPALDLCGQISNLHLLLIEHTREHGNREMRVHSERTRTRREQLGLPTESTTKITGRFPAGIILRHDPGNKKLERFIFGNAAIVFVMFNFDDVLDIIDERGSLHAYLSDWQIPIVTATNPDKELRNRTRKQIRRVLRNSQPALYVPDAGEVYCDDPEYRQRAGLREYRLRVDWLVDEIQRRNLKIQLLPLAKAMEPWHCKEMLPWFQKHGFQDYAYYTRQYCNNGNHINTLVNHMNNFSDIINPNNIFAIARHGKTHLQKFPSTVSGASGFKQFHMHCDYQQELFETWRTDLETNALNALMNHSVLQYQ